jgi:CubicO group peptidase (beta-lactamase class C family)
MYLINRLVMPALLLSASLLPAPPADTPPASGQKGIADALKPFVTDGSLAGAVTLVADRDRVLTLEAAGYCDVAARKPMRTDALFWIASQSKPITAGCCPGRPCRARRMRGSPPSGPSR